MTADVLYLTRRRPLTAVARHDALRATALRGCSTRCSTASSPARPTGTNIGKNAGTNAGTGEAAGPGGAGRGERTGASWPTERRRPEWADARHLLDYLMLKVRDELDGLQRMAVRYADFCQALAQSSTVPDRQQLVLGYARDLGATRRERRRIERATRRWFGEQAVVDRYRRRRGEAEQRLTFALQRLGWTVEHVLGLMKPQHWAAFWERLRLERLLRASAEYEGDLRVHVAALRCLLRPLQSIGHPAAAGLLSARTLDDLRQVASDPTRDVWLQCAALSLLTVAAEDRGLTLLRQRLATPQGGDDLFVRRHIVRLLPSLMTEHEAWEEWCAGLTEDPSPFVRQELAATLWQAPLPWAVGGLRRLALQDASPQVPRGGLGIWLAAAGSARTASGPAGVAAGGSGAGTARVGAARGDACRGPLGRAIGRKSLGGRADTRCGGGCCGACRPGRVGSREVGNSTARLQAQASSIPVRRWAAESRRTDLDAIARAASVLYDRLRAHRASAA